MFSLKQIAAWIPGATIHGSPDCQVLRIHTDSRSLRPADLFLALRGEQFDGHSFMHKAQTSGASAVLGEVGVEASGLSGLQVKDSRLALGQIAAGYRAGFDLPLIAVTGSNGKTTVTQMLAAILAAWKGEEKRLATAGNFNNEIGVPLTLLRLTAQHEAAVVELGMNHPGEIAYLANLVHPTVALVNNAQREHMEFMSSVEAVADENAAVFGALDAKGIAVYPADDAQAARFAAAAAGKQELTFGLESGTIQARLLVSDGSKIELVMPNESAVLLLNTSGEHNVHNACAAAACAFAAGVDLASIKRGLESFRPVRGRLVQHKLQIAGCEVVLVDDTYNANPDSMRAAIDVLALMSAPRALIVGDMGEVGEDGPEFHREIGAYAASKQIELFASCGSLMAHADQAFAGQKLRADGKAELVELLSQQLAVPRFRSVLVKGSRFMGMETVVQHIQSMGQAC